jgi:hypothetical protein
MRWLARRHALEILKRQAGGTFRTSKAMGLACEPQRWAREHAQQRDAIPMDQNLGELPASCARMQKNCETNPMTSFTINGLAFPASCWRALPVGALPREKNFAGVRLTKKLAVTPPSTHRSCAVTSRPHGRLRRRGRRRKPGPGRAMRSARWVIWARPGIRRMPVPCLR